MDNRSIMNYWKLGCLNITVDSLKSPTVLLLVCLKLNWVRKGMVQYKLFLGYLLKSDTFLLLANTAFVPVPVFYCLMVCFVGI